MSFLDRDYVPAILESLLNHVDQEQAASLFHHRRVDDHIDKMEQEDTRMVVTITPHGLIDAPLRLRQHIDTLQETATRISGIRRTDWGSAGFTYRYSNGAHPSLTVHRSGHVECAQPHLVVENGVVPIRVLLPLIGSVEVARRLAAEADIDGPLQIDLTLLGVAGSGFHTPERRIFHGEYAFASDRVHQPWLIDVDGDRSDMAVQRLADILWQASGFAECHWYDDQGEWTAWANHFA